IVPDMILCSFYIFILAQISTASEEHFKTPFFVFFTASGVYSVLTIVTFQVVTILRDNQQITYVHIILVGINAFSTSGATFGKAVIAFHRYFVLKRRDFTEQVSIYTLELRSIT
ncbi:hypothetical protein PMAYCL1PPCAC_28274, partial [Pristionchus mayeri]